MTQGWYVAATNTGCQNAGMPAKVLIYVMVNQNGYLPIVTSSPMAYNTSPCF